MKFSQVWDLDSIFKGGSSSSSFLSAIETVKKDLKALNTTLENGSISKAISMVQSIGLTIREMDTFALCLQSQNTDDNQAIILCQKLRDLMTCFENSNLLLGFALKEMSKDDFEELLKAHSSVAFALKEKRAQMQEKLSTKEETFINDFSKDGYHAWGELWETIIGEMTFPFQGEMLHFGQIENKLSNLKRELRQEAFDSIEKGFDKRKASFSQALNHLGGFRLEIYEKRNWSDPLKEPLELNRQSKDSLTTMWDAIAESRDILIKYLMRKADLLKLNALSWIDLSAPLSTLDETITYDEAAKIILEQFETFSPKLSAFSKKALKNKWVEAEDRKGKSAGGYCCALPNVKESRIFMTFSKTITNLYTLAHELGHAFHNEVLFPLDEMVQHPTMGLAETASTMAEMIVTKAMIKKEKDPKKKLFLLDDHLSRAVSYLFNIYARFLFETRFYEKRKEGALSYDELSKIMEEAQKEAYGNALSTYHPLFWAAKMHFFITEYPFYNFPYTFGYLFSLGIYSHSKSADNFEDILIPLLEDTGRMSAEDLAQKHLGANLKAKEFWQQGLNVIHEDIHEFIKLSKEVS